MSGIKNKVIAITGASSGIDEATARRLAANHARVILAARRTGRLDTIAEALRAAARAIAFAIEQPDDVKIGHLTIRPTIQS